MRLSPYLCGVAALSLALPGIAVAEDAPTTAPQRATVAPEFAKFIPAPTKQLKIDYRYWDDILNNLVFLTGVSTRQIASKPEALTGSRFVAEHTSPYRLEGNKIPFSKLQPEHVETLQAYKRELEELGGTVDIAALPKKEQLAYWINLHNVTAIMLIAENYPVIAPSKLQIGETKALFHDAKVISVAGSKLSLRDIRENIVYPNWQDPTVIYGFFLGDIGSPSIQSQAFDSSNVNQLLVQNADEFVNSLRAFSRGGVSKIYKDAERFYFPNFEQDVRQHIQQFMWDDVYEELTATGPLKINAYEYDIADMEGGRAPIVVGNVTINGRPVKDAGTYAIARYTNQIKDKSEILLKQGKIKRGEVIVGDPDEEQTTEEGKPSPENSES
jgi:Protein of unknown function, DUF547